jgi:tetratricopeptide (TPR) repeat protein
MFGEEAKTQIQNILLFLKMLKNQFLYLFIFLPLGFYYLYKKQKNIFIFLSLILFFNLIAIFVYKIIPELTDHEAYFLPAYTVLALFISYGLFFIYKKLKSKTLHLVFYSVVIILILFFLKINYFYITMRNYFFAYDYARNVFLQIPDNSILFNQVDYNVFPLWYLQYVEERRPDLCTFALLFLTRPWYVETLLKKYPYVKPPDNLYKFYKEVFFDLVNNNLDKNIYYTFSKDAEIEIPYQDNLKKIGILFKVLPSGSLQEEEKLFTFDYNYRSIFDKNIYKDIWAREVMLVYGYYYAYLGEELIRKNRIAEAISMLHKSLKFDNKNASYIAALASAYLINKDYNKALEYFKKAYEFQQSKDYLRNIVFCLHKLGKKDKAQEYLKQMKKISP